MSQSTFFSSAAVFAPVAVPTATIGNTVYRYMTRKMREINDSFPIACMCGKLATGFCECGNGPLVFKHLEKVTKKHFTGELSDFYSYNPFEELETEPLHGDTDQAAVEMIYRIFNTKSSHFKKVFRYYGLESDRSDHAELRDTRPLIEECPPIRSAMLLYKLRAIIRQLRISRLGRLALMRYLFEYPHLASRINPKYLDLEYRFSPIHDNYQRNYQTQADVPPITTELGPIPTNKQNVTLVDSRIPVTTSSEGIGVSWVDYSNSDVTTRVDAMTDKWLLIDDFEWNTTQYKSYQIKKLNLPIDIFSKLKACDYPVLQPFATHQFARGDMEIKIVLNTNQFSLGMLCASVLYQFNDDQYGSRRENVYTQLQNHHALINSSVSNSVILEVPYKHMTPAIHTGGRDDLGTPLDICTLFIWVLNPLTIGTGGVDSINGSIFINFKNWEFFGQKHASISPLPVPTISKYEVQMMPLLGAAAVGAVEGALQHVSNVPNTDLPPTPIANTQVITPVPGWSSGTQDVRHLFPMRLNPLGQTPHPPGCSTSDNQTAKSIARRWGYVGTLTWNKVTERNTTLIQLESNPIMHSSILPKWTDQSINQYVYPPISIISSMFCATRCSLEWKFVAAHCVGKQTGRLMIGYVPGATAQTNMSLMKLRAGHHIVWDLQECSEIIYTSPFVNNKAWTKRKYGPNNSDLGREPLGYIYVIVLNKLVPMQSVPDLCYINFFLRSGPDFECAIPVQPALTPGWDLTLIQATEKELWAVPSYAPYYWGHWSELGDGNETKLVARYSSLPYSVSIFTEHRKFNKDNYGYFVAKSSDAVMGSYMSDSTKKLVEVKFVVPFKHPSDNTLILVPYDNNAQCGLAAKLYWEEGKFKEAIHESITCTDTTSNTYCVGNPVWQYKPIKGQRSNSINYRVQTEDKIILPTKYLSSLNNGRISFGEDFSDLKDYMRRPQYYTTLKIPTINTTYPSMIFRFPIMPQGLALKLSGDAQTVNQINNRLRYNPIALISSAFRYYRGGVRLRFVGTNVQGHIIVQVRPDYPVTHEEVKSIEVDDTGDNVLNFSYATHIHPMGLVPYFEIEVPFYNLGLFNLCQRPTALESLTRKETHDYISLGECFVGGQGSVSGYINVFISLADDFTFSTWQGFPPVAVLDEIDNHPPSAGFRTLNRALKPTEYQVQMMGWIAGKAMQPIKEVVQDSVSKVTNDLKQVWQDSNPFGEEESSWSGKVWLILTSLANLILNFNLKTLILTVVGILGYFGIAAVSFYKKIKEVCTRFYDVYFAQPNAQKQGQKSLENTQKLLGQELKDTPSTSRTHSAQDSSIAGGFIALIVAILGLVGVTISDKAPKESWISTLVKGLSTSCRAANNVYTFVTNAIETIKQILTWVCCNNSFSGWLYNKFSNTQHLFLDRWIQESHYLLRDSIQNKIMVHRQVDLLTRLHFACDVGRLILAKLPAVDNNSVYMRINSIHKDLLKLMREAGVKGVHALTRIEPYMICISGANGIGKSKTHLGIITHLANEHKITAPDNKLSATIDVNQKWWNDVRCTEQFALIDDMWNIRTDETVNLTLQALALLSGDVPCSVPKADVDSKENYFSPQMVSIYTNHPFYKPNNVDGDFLYPRIHDYWHAQLTQIPIDIACDECLQPFITHTECLHCKNHLPPRQWPSSERDKMHLVSDYHHLCFSKFLDYKEDAIDTKKICYQCFLKQLSNDFKVFNTQAVKNFNQNLRRFENCTQTYIDDSHWESYETLEDWIKDYYDKLEHTRLEKLKLIPSTIKGISMRTFNFLVNVGDAEDIKNMMTEREYNYKVAIISSKINKLKDKAISFFKKGHISQALYSIDHPQKYDWDFFSTLFPMGSPPGEARADPLDCSVYDPKNKIESGAPINAYKFPPVYESTFHRDILNTITWTCETEIIDKVFVPLMTKIFSAFNSKVNPNNIIDKIHEYTRHSKLVETTNCLMVHCKNVCIHMSVLFRECVVVEGKEWYLGPHKLGICENELCPMKVPFLKYLIYRDWITSDYSRFVACKQGRRVIPDDFYMPEYQTELYFKLVINKLKDFWLSKLSPLLRTVWDWLKRYAVPFILLSMLGTYLTGCYSIGRDLADGMIDVQKQETENVARLLDTHDLVIEWKNQVQGVYNSQPINKNPAPPTNFVSFHAPQDMVPYASSPSHMDAIANKIKDNFVTFVIEEGSQCIYLHAVGIRSNMVLLPKHYIDHIYNRDKCKIGIHYTYDRNLIRTNGKCIPLDIKNLKYVNIHFKDKPSNHCVLYLPSTFNQFKDITTMFKPLAQHNFSNKHGYVMCHRNVHPEGIYINRDFGGTIVKDGDSSLEVKYIYTYNKQYPGMCGSLIYTDGDKPIIGMHIAGDSNINEGVSEMLFYEMFNSIPVQKTAENNGIILPKCNLSDEDLVLTGSITPIYKVEKHLAQYQPRETKYTKSAIHNIFPVNTAPAVLSVKDSRYPSKLDPLIAGCSKHGLKPLEFPYHRTQKIIQHVAHDLINKMPSTQIRIYSIEEAVLGLPNRDHYDPLTLKTSAGFPLSSYKPASAKGKYWLFDIDYNNHKLKSVHEKLLQEISLLYDSYKRGIRPNVVFVDCLKDEILPKEKIPLEGKTRVFSIAPVQYTILFRQYFFDFLALFKLNRITLGHAIGINPESSQWAQLYDRLHNHVHTKIVAGDYSNFGPAFNSDLAEGAITAIMLWYEKYDPSPENNKIRWMLLKELIGSRHLCGDLVYSVHCGCPSGSPITDILNSIVNWFYIYHAWIELVQLPLYSFDSHAYMCVYGDDILMGVSDALADKFNTLTISNYFATKNIKFTDFDKGDKIIPYRSIQDVEFLKRKFVSHPRYTHLKLAQIAERSIQSAANWVSKEHDLHDATRVNALASSLLAYSHGPAYYDDVVSKLRNALERSHVKPVNFMRWIDLDDRVFNNSMDITKIINQELNLYVNF
uniref:Genome polyprotein n=1 Tax=Crocidura shantungensis picorna-like virus 2 TaxID=3139522 RepID=A0AB38ZKD5_9VIRU